LPITSPVRAAAFVGQVQGRWKAGKLIWRESVMDLWDILVFVLLVIAIIVIGVVYLYKVV